MTVWTVVSVVFGVVILIMVGAMMLPRHLHIERQALLNVEPEDVIALAASNTGYQTFNPYLTADPDLKIEPFGPDNGVGSGFYFDGKDGKGSQTVSAVTKRSVHYAIDLGSMGQPTQTITVSSAVNGTLVSWSMEMDTGNNPIARVFGLFMDRIVGKTFEQGLDNLAGVY